MGTELNTIRGLLSPLVTQMSRVISVPFEQLRPSPLNTYEIVDVEDLANSIRTCGLLTPLTVVGPDDTGIYEILAGERRYRAISHIKEEYGWTDKIPCHLIGSSNISNVQKSIAIEVSNIEQRDGLNIHTHRFAVVKLFKQLAAEGIIEKGRVSESVAAYLGVSPRYAAMYTSVFTNGIPDLQTAASANKGDTSHVPVDLAAKIAVLPEEDQTRFLEYMKQGYTRAEAYTMVTGKEAPTKKKAEHPTSKESQSPETNTFVGEDAHQVSDLNSHIPEPSYPQSPQYVHPQGDWTPPSPTAPYVPAVPHIPTSPPDPIPPIPPDPPTPAEPKEPVRKIAVPPDAFGKHGFDPLAFLREIGHGGSGYDEEVDTSGSPGTLKGQSHIKKDFDAIDDAMRKTVRQWIRLISDKIDNGDELDEQDADILESFSTLIDCFNTDF